MKYFTQVPNKVFDVHLPNLTGSELKVLLVIIRQTYGWVDTRTGKRKVRDRISHGQFVMKTALSRRVVSRSINSLVEKRLIQVSDYSGSILGTSNQRKGKLLYYSFCVEYFSNYPKSYGFRSVGELIIHPKVA